MLLVLNGNSSIKTELEIGTGKWDGILQYTRRNFDAAGEKS
jgi:hypothetical protein